MTTMDEPRLSRPNSIIFNLREYTNKSTKYNHVDILNEVSKSINQELIVGIQIRVKDCIVTLKDSESKDTLKAQGFSLGNRHVTLSDADLNITQVTLKDAPVEMKDINLITMLSCYGDVIPNSMNHGKIKGTEIETGTRYAKLLNVPNPIPTEVQVGHFMIRVFCDNGKTVCSFCQSTEHLPHQCLSKPRSQKLCYNCNSADHLAGNCPNIVCHYCGQQGHKSYQCKEKSFNLKIEERGTVFYNSKSYDGVLAFRGEKDVLSNLYRVEEKVQYADRTHASVEHGYKMTKATYYERDDLINAIDGIDRPMDAMFLVDKELKNADEREEWVRERERIMTELVVSKSDRCEKFRSALIASEGMLLVEATRHAVYASGISSVEKTLKTPPNQWPGRNRLGLIMMEVRDQILQKETRSDVTHVNDNHHSGEILQGASSNALNPPSILTCSSPANGQESDINNLSFTRLAEDIDKAADRIADRTSTPHLVTPQRVKQPINTIILSDSILNGTPAPEGVEISAEAGAKLDEIQVVTDNVKNTENVINVIIAVGINDLKENLSVGGTIARYSSAIETVRSKFPQASILVSGLLPRKDDKGGARNFNEKVVEVNQYLNESSKSGQIGAKFIGNTNIFRGPGYDSLYLQNDNSGIHLSRDGQLQLVNNIVEATAKSSKRPRPEGTPPSVEKEGKSRKCTPSDKPGQSS